MAMQELLDEVNEIVPEVQGVVGQLRRCVRTVYLPTHTLVPES
jgi:hypothetical protein